MNVLIRARLGVPFALALAAAGLGLGTASPAEAKSCVYLGEATTSQPTNGASGGTAWPVFNSCKGSVTIKITDGRNVSSGCAKIGYGWHLFVIGSPSMSGRVVYNCGRPNWTEGRRAPVKQRRGEVVEARGPLDVLSGLRGQDYGYIVRNTTSHKANFRIVWGGKGANGHDYAGPCLNVGAKAGRALTFRGTKTNNWRVEGCKY